MKFVPVLLLSSLAILPLGDPAQPDRAASTWLVPPPGAPAAFSQTTSAQELETRFGTEHLSAEDVSDGEYGTLPGAVLFRADPSRRIELVWADPQTRTGLARVRVRGAHSVWRVAPGITLGTPLDELQRLNGRPVAFQGFGFDGHGLVQSWKGGKLSFLTGSPRVMLRVSPPRGAPSTEITLGDRSLVSDMPELADQRIFVWEITVFFEDPERPRPTP
jgi:hypothetical protein